MTDEKAEPKARLRAARERERGKTVNERAKNKGRYTICQRVEERFPRCVSLFEV